MVSIKQLLMSKCILSITSCSKRMKLYISDACASQYLTFGKPIWLTIQTLMMTSLIIILFDLIQGKEGELDID